MNRFKFIVQFLVSSILICSVLEVSARTITSSYFSVWIPDHWKSFDGKIYSSFDGQSAQCIFFRNPRNRHQDFALSLCSVDMEPGPLMYRIGFRRVDGEIVRAGSMDSQKALIQEKNGHLMVSASASCGTTDASGFHAAGGNCYSAAIFGAPRNLSLETDGTESLELVSKIANSIKIRTVGDVQSLKKQLVSVQIEENQK